MSHRSASFVVAFAAAAASFATAAPADAGLIGCATSNVDISRLIINAGGAVNCSFDTASDCLYVYDPLFYFPTWVVSETTQYALCHV